MSMKLVILGLLMEGDKHPYEIRQTMKERKLHNFVKIKDGSLYYAADQLKKEEYIEVMDTLKDSNRPDKTVYRISDKGKSYFQTLLLEKFSESTPLYHPVYAALPFARHGDPSQIAEILEKRIEQCEQFIIKMKDVYDEHIDIVSRGVLHLMNGCREQSKTELKWLKRVYKDAQDDRLKESGVPLELDEE